MSRNEELIKLYSQLREMKQTAEVKQIKKQIEETLYYNLKYYHLELAAIGEVIGYDRLKKELQNTIDLIDIVSTTGISSKKKK